MENIKMSERKVIGTIQEKLENFLPIHTAYQQQQHFAV
jgi:hypothetical protein